MNLPYVVPRVMRHFLPERLTRYLLLRGLVIKPGLETSDPRAAVRRYEETLRADDDSLTGKRVLVFGYGGRFDVGVGLLEAGAGFVVLCDRYAPPDDDHNQGLIEANGSYLAKVEGRVRPRPERMQLFQGDVRDLKTSTAFPRVDLVISNSVYEHVEDVRDSTRALAELTQSGGKHIHFVDLRDHFFRYPFEMLTFSESAWRHWLNPTSNHNRLRLADYRRVFQASFEDVVIETLQEDMPAFERARKRIRNEFLSGDAHADSATLIRILASKPRR